MTGLLPYIMALVFASVVASLVHPTLVRFALWKNIVDKPNARRLNRVPVPVLGGVGVFLGFIIALYTVAAIMGIQLPSIYIVLMVLMLGVGLVDDICDLSPYTKFSIQILAVLLLYFFCDLRIDNFYGIFGLHEVSMLVSLPLTLVVCVGLINSINLIDGIDGLSSGYSLVASLLFGVWAYMFGDRINLLISSSLIGALIPFFIYNVFGKKYKMFIGDAGSHLLGIVFCIVALNTIDSPAPSEMSSALIPFTFAVLSHPIMDTLRVMAMRICKGKPPFMADKTHLHHALVGQGFSHLATTLIIIGLDLIVVAAWVFCFQQGMSTTTQMLATIAVAILCIVLPYPLLTKGKH